MSIKPTAYIPLAGGGYIGVMHEKPRPPVEAVLSEILHRRPLQRWLSRTEWTTPLTMEDALRLYIQKEINAYGFIYLFSVRYDHPYALLASYEGGRKQEQDVPLPPWVVDMVRHPGDYTAQEMIDYLGDER